MARRNLELWAALAVILAITLLYGGVVSRLDPWPGASGLFGHSLGLAGFGLMLMTETLYSLRKRSRSARWGRMAFWLQIHIFTGLVGPYMVLLHTAWKYNGVAGMAMLLTIIIVISGFIGRYIYTAVPRTVDGAAVEAAELKQQVAATEAALQQWLSTRPEIADALVQGLTAFSEAPSPTSSLVLGRIFSEWRYHRQWQRQKRQLQVLGNTHIQDLEKLLNRRQVLERQVASLAVARQMLALWHSVHVPLGVSLFTLAFIHIGGALYYATLLR